MSAPEQTAVKHITDKTGAKPGRLVLSILLWLTLAAYLLLSLLSHNDNDSAWTHRSDDIIRNAGGQLGANLADWLGFLIGPLALILPVLMIWHAYTLWRPRPQALSGWQQAVAWFVALLALSALLFLHRIMPGYSLPNAAGGALGQALGGAMLRATGLLGSTVVLLVLSLVCFTLATGVSWLRVMDTLGQWLWWLGQHAWALLSALSSNLHARLSPQAATANASSSLNHGLDTALMMRTHALTAEAASIKSSNVRIEPILAGTLPVQQAAARIEPKFQSLARPIPVTQATPLDTPRLRPEITIAPMAEIKAAKPAESQRQLFAPAAGQGPLPSVDLLDPAEIRGKRGFSAEALEAMSRLLEIKLKEFNVDAQVVAVQPGPVITRFEIQPAAGVKVARITNIAKDLARAMAMVSVRVVEVIPGKSVVGIEVPNQDREMVRLSEILTSHAFVSKDSPLTLALGKDIAGHPIVADLARMPHLLVAGTTGSGKSVGVNAMILSMLFKAGPDDLRMIMIDPKMLELSVYDKIPHLLTPVVTDMKDAANALRWCVAEMERRYKLMANLGVRNLVGYNKKVADAIAAGHPILDPLWRADEDIFRETAPELVKLPYVVVVIDEFADMMMIVGKKVEELIARIAQKARAAGIHLILATQRPSVDVITGLIKANIPTRIAFQVSSKIDSRTILDQGGAEQLLGHGDMLYLPPGTSLPERVHGAFVSDEEVHRVCGDWRARGQPNYIDEILEGSLEVTDSGGKGGGFGGFDDVGGDPEQDALYDDAVAFVLETRRPSISYVQRKFKIGYNRAARLIEAMENAGLVSSMQTNGQRELLVPKRD